MILALDAPSPKTVCVAFFQRSQALQPAAACRSPAIVLAGGYQINRSRAGCAISRSLRLIVGNPFHAVIPTTVDVDGDEEHAPLPHDIFQEPKFIPNQSGQQELGANLGLTSASESFGNFRIFEENDQFGSALFHTLY